jgi:hypothetical protein
VRDDAHRIEEFAPEEFHPHNALGGIDLEVFLKQEQVVGEPEVGAVVEQADEFSWRVEQEHARAAAALLGFKQRGPVVAPVLERGSNIIECQSPRMRDVEAVHQAGLRRLAEFEGESARAVEDACAAQLQGTYQG